MNATDPVDYGTGSCEGIWPEHHFQEAGNAGGAGGHFCLPSER